MDYLILAKETNATVRCQCYAGVSRDCGEYESLCVEDRDKKTFCLLKLKMNDDFTQDVIKNMLER